MKTKKILSAAMASAVAFVSISPVTWASLDANDGFSFSSSSDSRHKGAIDYLKLTSHNVPWFVPVPNQHAAGVAETVKPLERKFRDEGNFERFVSDEVIVRFKKDRINLGASAGYRKAMKFSSDKKLKSVDTYARGNFSVLRSSSGENAETLIARLKKDPDVELVQPNFKYYSKGVSWSNDTYAGNLWAIENLGQSVNGTYGRTDSDSDVSEAWSVNEWTNSWIVVAVIDSGVAYNHPDLLPNMWDGSNCKSENGTYLGWCVHGYDYQDNDKNPLPTIADHGTHVAGTIAAVKNNSVGIAGVAPKAKIMAIKFWGTTATVVKAVNFAKQNGAKVINASFWDAYVNGSGYNHALLDVALYEAIRDFPWVFVAAAGNDSRNHDSGSSSDMMYPAGFSASSIAGPGLPNVIAVAATDQNDSLAYFSDYGSKSVALGAPGTNVYSTVPSSSSTVPYFQDFESVTEPTVPSWIQKSGNWWTINAGGDWGNVLFGDYSSPYLPNSNALATFPTSNLWGAASAALDFWTICDTPYDTQNYGDYMALEISSDGSSYSELFKWNEVAIDSDRNPDSYAMYHFQDVDVPSQYLTSSFRFRFRWVTDSGSNAGYVGCLVDDVKVSRSDMSDGSDNRYAYKDGTSMAAPHVAGAVALAWGYSPSSSVSEIVNAIVNSWDALSSLSGKTASGKRLNAYKALSSLLVPSVTSLGAYRDSSKSVAIGSGTWLTGSLSPYFAWTSTGSAVSYNVNIDRSSSFAQFGPVPSGNFYSGTTSSMAYSGSSFSTDGSYSFCVRGKWSAAQLGDWKCAWMKIDSTWPAAPVVVSPANGASVGATLASLNWNAAADAGIGMGSWSYRFEVATDSWMLSPILADGVSSTGASVSSLDDGTYFWRVRATDSLGNVGAWTSVRSFTKDTVPPAAPTEVSLNGGNFVNAANQSSLVLTAKSSAEDSGSKARYFVSIGGKSVTGLWTVASDGNVRITGVNVSSLGDGELDVSLRIEDLIGNVSSTGSSTVFKDAIPPTGSLSFASGALTNSGIALVSLSASEPVTYELTGTGLAQSYSGTLNGPLSLPVTLSQWDGPKVATVTYRDAGGSTSPAYVAKIILDTVPPSLSSLSAADGDSVTLSPFALSGKASDANGVAAVKVNGSQAAGTDSWSVQLPVVGGTNRLSVVAYDRAGNSVSQEFSVVRVPSKPAPQVSVTAKDAVRVSFATDVDATGSVVYGASPESLGTSVSDTSYSKSHAVALSGLLENTRYYYRAFGSVEGRDGPMSVTGSFVTPKSVESSAVASDRKYDAPLHVSDGTPDGADVPLSDRIEIRSSNGSGSIVISAGSLKITAASGNWDKIISPPEFVSYSGGLSVDGYAAIPEYVAKAGSESDSISFSGAKVTVRMPVPARLNGKVLKVYRSEDSQATFAFVASCTVVQSICEFDTPGFSVFVPLEGSDSVPDQFAFESVVNALPGSEVVSKPVRISGINVTVTATAANATLVVDGKDVWTSADVNSGASVSLKVKAPENSWEKIVGTLAVGGISAWFQVTSGDKPVSASSGGLYGGGGGSGGWSPYFGASSSSGSASAQTNASSAQKPAIASDDSAASSGSKKNFAVKDVSDHWSKQYVLNLVRLGIVNNAPKFRPDDSLTRAEFLKIALNAAEVEIPGSVPDSKFSDVSEDSWYAPYVAAALEKGVISGNSDKFRPDDRITRAEVAKILSGLLDDGASDAAEAGVFSDVPKESEFAAPISLLYAKGLFSGQVSGDVRVFRPTDSITRAEIAKVTSIGFELALR